MEREDYIKWALGLLVIVVLACAVVWAQVYFAQNCLKSHSETYTYYTSECIVWLSGKCEGYTITPHVGVTQVCDQWKEGK